MNEQTGSAPSAIVTFLRKRDYVMVRELGSGACGRTVLLHDDQINENFVCKKYSPYSESQRAALFENFTREIKLLHQVHHPNVVRIFNYFLYPSDLTGYILMEFVNGDDIDAYITDNPDRLGDVFVQTINGFAHLEQAGILHRDIRPGNLMVNQDGAVKIIDLGFGKQVTASKDFDKSISLNWWCEKPAEFGSGKYDFSTEVYFVGKLFEKMIRDNGILRFDHALVLGKMCTHEPDVRIGSFNTVLQELRNTKFSEADFSWAERESYRTFANELCLHVTKIENGSKYKDDFDKVIRQLNDVYKKVMLEDMAPNPMVSECFIDGIYYYRKSGFSVSAIREFLESFRSCTAEKAQIILANLHTRLDAIVRYSQSPPEDVVPF